MNILKEKDFGCPWREIDFKFKNEMNFKTFFVLQFRNSYNILRITFKAITGYTTAVTHNINSQHMNGQKQQQALTILVKCG
jgi:hypothetical protein